MLIKNIIPSFHAIIKSTLRHESNLSYPFISTFVSQNNNYGPTILVENVKWTNYQENSVNLNLNIVSYQTKSGLTFVKVQYHDFLNNLVIGTPLKVVITDCPSSPSEPTNYNCIYIGNQTFVYNGLVFSIDPCFKVFKYITYNRYSSVFLLYTYWHGVIDPSIGSFYQRVIPELPSFITSLHVIGGIRFVGYYANTQKDGINFALEYSLEREQYLNNLLLYLIYDENFEYMPNRFLNFNTNPDLDENYYQITSGEFKTIQEEKKPDRIIIYNENDWKNVYYYPLETNLMFAISDEEGNLISFDGHNLFKLNTYSIKENSTIIPQLFNIKIDSDNNVSSLETLQDFIVLINNPNFDLKYINDYNPSNRKVFIFNFGNIKREDVGIDFNIKYYIKEIMRYNNVVRNTNMILIRTEPNINIQKLNDNLLSTDIVITSSDVGGKIVGSFGLIENKIYPVPYRIDFNNIGNRILIFKETFERFDEIYIIYDKNALDKEFSLRVDNDYPFHEIYCLPKNFVIFVTNYSSDIITNLIPDETPYNFNEVTRNIPNDYSYYVGIIDPLKPTPKLLNLNILDKYKVFSFFV